MRFWAWFSFASVAVLFVFWTEWTAKEPSLAVAVQEEPMNPPKSMAQLNELIQKFPRCDSFYTSRAVGYERAGEYGKALQDYRTVVELCPEVPNAHHRLAWFLATCPRDEFRNGKAAVEHALKFGQWDLDTLAVAYAESGDFEKAVVCEEKLLKRRKLPNRQAAEARARLALFQAHKAYHE